MNIRTLGDSKKGKEYSKVDEKKPEKNDKNTNSYAGGEKSGLAVEYPDAQKILDKAKVVEKYYSSYKLENNSPNPEKMNMCAKLHCMQMVSSLMMGNSNPVMRQSPKSS